MKWRKIIKKGNYYTNFNNDVSSKIVYLYFSRSTKNGNHQCDYCEKSFRTVQSLSTHKARTHFPDLVFKCKICNKKFFMEEAYKVHCNKHQGIKPYKCQQCDKGK